MYCFPDDAPKATELPTQFVGFAPDGRQHQARRVGHAGHARDRARRIRIEACLEAFLEARHDIWRGHAYHVGEPGTLAGSFPLLTVLAGQADPGASPVPVTASLTDLRVTAWLRMQVASAPPRVAPVSTVAPPACRGRVFFGSDRPDLGSSERIAIFEVPLAGEGRLVAIHRQGFVGQGFTAAVGEGLARRSMAPPTPPVAPGGCPGASCRAGTA